MMTPSQPTEYVAEHREEIANLALDLLAVETVNPPGDTTEIVSLLEEALPVATERFAVDPAKPNLLATLPGERDRTLLFNGHLDTVPFNASAWSHDPLGERDGERIYGRGATDMKGPLAGMMTALRAFVETDTRPPINLAFAFVSDEETGGDAGLPAVLEAGHLDADACIIGEPTCREDHYSVTVADRGSIWLTLEATGEGAHGSRPMLGINAIDQLYEAVSTLRERFGNAPLDINATMEPILDESIEYYTPTMGAETARELFATPSINLGTIEGGSAINSVPQSARAEIDVRLTATVQTPDVLSKIRGCVADCEDVTLTNVSWSIGTAESVENPLVEAVVSTAEAVINERVYRRSATGGGDAKKLRNAGVPTVEFALGTDTVHAIDEYTTVDMLATNATVYTQLPTVWDALHTDSIS